MHNGCCDVFIFLDKIFLIIGRVFLSFVLRLLCALSIFNVHKLNSLIELNDFFQSLMEEAKDFKYCIDLAVT